MSRHSIDKSPVRAEDLSMSPGRAFVLVALFAVMPLCVLADGTVSGPNPVGEKVYYSHLAPHVWPIIVIGCNAFVAGWVIHRLQHGRRNIDHQDPTGKIAEGEIGSSPLDEPPREGAPDQGLADRLILWRKVVSGCIDAPAWTNEPAP